MLRGAVAATVKRSGIDKDEIDYAVAGTVIAEVKTSNVMREAALGAGLFRILNLTHAFSLSKFRI